VEVHLFTVIALLLLGVVGLVVGVANDAVNFLNSSVGAKVAPYRVILLIASVGMILGVTFSSGMMEIARKGIFNPEQFLLAEIMVIFFAVMIQNILLLDLFNTYGLPTSTTVAIVFGLFGAGLAVSTIKIIDANGGFEQIYQYINVANLFAIITAIFVSVLFAFVFGSISQYISRLIFTFDYQKTIKRYGGIWGGIALTFIIYFIVIKGAKGASFMDAYTVEWIQQNTGLLILSSWAICTIILQILISVFKINIFKIIVLVGTFALAMSFAANDLVNFIGAPLAGLTAYQIGLGLSDIETSTMGALAEPFKADTIVLLISGLIMVLTLFLSKKSRTVQKTEISLGRQDEGYERFQSYLVSRLLVRITLVIIDFLKKITPVGLRNRVNNRLDLTKYNPQPDDNGELPSFDLVRAAVNLVVASALISYGTSLKLPLSTTYVTFIVAMASALPDKAWGRESAVYRVSGVLTVVGGWFFTAIMASLIAAAVAVVCFFGDIYAIVGFLIFTAFIYYRSSLHHKNREIDSNENDKHFLNDESTKEQTYAYLFENISNYFKSVLNAINSSYNGLYKQDLKLLNKSRKISKKLYKNSDYLVADVLKSLKFAEERELEQGHAYAKALGALHEMASRTQYITKQIQEYFDNNHQKFQNEQVEELRLIEKGFTKILETSIEAFDNNELVELTESTESIREFNVLIRKFNKNQLKRIQKSTTNKRRSMLYLNILDDTQGIIYNLMRVTAAFSVFTMKNKE
jgi:phosphate/sulfate permease